MKQFIKWFVLSIVIFFTYAVGLSYFGPSLFVSANAGWLIVIFTLTAVSLLSAYLWLFKKAIPAAIGIFCGVLVCLAALQILLS